MFPSLIDKKEALDILGLGCLPERSTRYSGLRGKGVGERRGEKNPFPHGRRRRPKKSLMAAGGKFREFGSLYSLSGPPPLGGGGCLEKIRDLSKCFKFF